MSILIRVAQPNDAVQIIDGINLVCHEGGAFHVTHFEPDQAWNDALYHSGDGTEHYLGVADLNDKIVGAVNLFRPSTNSLSRHRVQLGIYVLPGYRRQGIGSQLLESAIVWSKVRQVEKITLEVFATNLPAQRLYEKYHFVIEGRQIKQIKIQDCYVDMILMANFL